MADIAPKLLDWPFLLFIVLIVFVIMFRDYIGAVLSRGDITISWGKDRSIRIGELSDNFDAELDPLRDEVDALKESVEALRMHTAAPPLATTGAAGTAPLSHEARKAAREKMAEAMISGKFRWRTLNRLAQTAGVSEEAAHDVLREHPDVVFAVGKTGHRIARLRGNRAVVNPARPRRRATGRRLRGWRG
jgi:hypothetical protein